MTKLFTRCKGAVVFSEIKIKTKATAMTVVFYGTSNTTITVSMTAKSITIEMVLLKTLFTQSTLS